MCQQKKQKFSEFEQLKQGDLLVKDFFFQFNRLSRFVKELVDTNGKRKKRFIKGPRAILHKEVTSQHPATFDDVVEQAQWAEDKDENVVAEIKEK